jgi:hypothetical protein
LGENVRVSDTPIILRYEGEGEFKPVSPYWGRQADKHYVIGEQYDLVEHRQRSAKSHAHYFASVHDAWANLPETIASEFPTDDHLRKYALIKAGFYDSSTVVCASKAEALRVAAFIRPIDEYGIVIAKDATVTRFTAKSQSMKAMGKDDFQKSKDAVLQILSDMIGTSGKALTQNEAA